MFTLIDQQCQLVNFNPRVETHGDEHVRAGDIKIAVNLEQAMLAHFHPTLRSLLFHKAGDPGDLANQVHDAPNLRFPKLGPLDWADEIVGADVEIEHGLGGPSNLKLGGCTINKFVIEPQEGGTVVLTFRVQAKPDEKAAGKLCMLQGESITVTLTPPDEADDAPNTGADSPPLNTAGDESAPNSSKRGRKSRTAALV